MPVRKITKIDIPALIEYGKQTYPNRNRVEESILYRFVKNPFWDKPYEEILIAENDENTVVGQYLIMPSEFKDGGKVCLSYWGMDYFVDEKYRSSQAGTVLAMKAVQLKCHFAIGLTPISLKIHSALKEKVVGQMYKYFRINNYFIALYQYFSNKQRNINSYIFPDKIVVQGSTFIKIEDPEKVIDGDGYLNDHILEFSRDLKFLRWRFYNYKNKYIVYKCLSKANAEEKDSFFVLRPMIWKKMNCLLLVDYRFWIKDLNMFSKILSATKYISKELKIPVTVTGCTLPSLFHELKKNKFLKFGTKMDIVTNFEPVCKDINADADRIYVTYADSDCDFNYGDNNFWEDLYE